MNEYLRAPKGYTRSDDSIREDLCLRLAHSHDVDVGDVEVSVESGVATLAGSVRERGQKRRIEDLAMQVSGVRDVVNRLQVAEAGTGDKARQHISGISQSAPSTGSSASSYGGGLEKGAAQEFPKGRDPYGGTTDPTKSVT